MCSALPRYGLPVNFQAMLLHPQKKNHKRLREVLNQQYAHLDSTASSGDKHEVSGTLGPVRLSSEPPPD